MARNERRVGCMNTELKQRGDEKEETGESVTGEVLLLQEGKGCTISLRK